jgi:hypothetical protein
VSAAAISTLISTLIAALPITLVGRDASHLLFIVAVALLCLFLGFGRRGSRRSSAGIVFVFVVFEPMGRTFLRQETPPKYILAALPLMLVVAYFFGLEEGSGKGITVLRAS